MVYPCVHPHCALGLGRWLACKTWGTGFCGRHSSPHQRRSVSTCACNAFGPAKGYKNGFSASAHNVPYIVIGASILWFGWFGFNAGSALTSGGLASSAFVATNTSAAAAALTWMLLSWFYHRPTVSGIATGAVAGLVAITPGAGYVNPIMGIPIGIGATLVCFYMMRLRNKTRVDESLDVWACHGMAGTWGAIATGIFATVKVNPAGANGLITGHFLLLGKQVITVLVVWVSLLA